MSVLVDTHDTPDTKFFFLEPPLKSISALVTQTTLTLFSGKGATQNEKYRLLFLIIMFLSSSSFQASAQCSARATATTRMASAAATPAGRASSASCATTSAKPPTAAATANASTESVSAPGDSLGTPATSVRIHFRPVFTHSKAKLQTQIRGHYNITVFVQRNLFF